MDHDFIATSHIQLLSPVSIYSLVTSVTANMPHHPSSSGYTGMPNTHLAPIVQTPTMDTPINQKTKSFKGPTTTVIWDCDPIATKFLTPAIIKHRDLAFTLNENTAIKPNPKHTRTISTTELDNCLAADAYMQRFGKVPNHIPLVCGLMAEFMGNPPVLEHATTSTPFEQHYFNIGREHTGVTTAQYKQYTLGGDRRKTNFLQDCLWECAGVASSSAPGLSKRPRIDDDKNRDF
ncbi:hypothetical protein FA15DRAFT_711450 [Coprinopsis marcescibilis]|uniref:Uncharacterized protein n=1 Tax=Coprinopsis marcescibilis TaxID=230819 RepID=A0A5C3KA39_COPMA|nr:hypothetical protein FA15DRAFT_711450 [Coprinopsis marcescibilis]